MRGAVGGGDTAAAARVSATLIESSAAAETLCTGLRGRLSGTWAPTGKRSALGKQREHAGGGGGWRRETVGRADGREPGEMTGGLRVLPKKSVLGAFYYAIPP
ncbi:hypothetical protein GWI33_010613 [Rhynchophorus ferrugineus]|uniref:Uncharacterized protein n=1 Tax=Rhynchophorus ferrugineus TaxID=354439 RepID=A0A834ISE7_RHYFE|nr:hypothetical protein GWI33_010613 [Rhynchophorus ferrugineus]